MNKTLFYCFTLILFVLFTGCDDDPILPVDNCPNPPCSDDPPPNKIGDLDTLWSVPISESYTGTEHIKVINGIVYFSVGANLIAYDAASGEEIWNWSDPVFDSRALSFEICELDGLVILQNGSRMVSVDLITGKTLKFYNQNIPNFGAMARGALLGDYYYYTRLKDGRSAAKLVRSHKDDLQNWEPIYSLINGEDTGGSWPFIESYNLWVNPTSGDSVLVFQHRMAVPNRVDVVAISLNTRETLWRHNDINVSGNSNHQQMLVMNDKAYIMAAEVVIAYDMFTGDVVWKHFDPGLVIAYMFHNFAYAESIDALIVKGATSRLYALDPETGAEKLFVPDGSSNSVGSGSPLYHNGIIYYNTIGHLHAIKASTGVFLWKERSYMKHNSGFNGDIGIDEDNGLLFAADGYYLYAIKMYED